MNIENKQSQMRKGVLEYCILSIIKRGEAYPGDIIDEMKNAGLQLLEGTLYPMLNRLKNAGILTYRWVESSFRDHLANILVSQRKAKNFMICSKPHGTNLQKGWRR